MVPTLFNLTKRQVRGLSTSMKQKNFMIMFYRFLEDLKKNFHSSTKVVDFVQKKAAAKVKQSITYETQQQTTDY